jgi:hypothetical protein
MPKENEVHAHKAGQSSINEPAARPSKNSTQNAMPISENQVANIQEAAGSAASRNLPEQTSQ